MEAPLPPPDMTYNEFRTWRKEQGIIGTRQDLADAWEEYNPISTSRSSKRASPRGSPRVSPRRSPRRSPKSPTRYAGLSSASIVGLPGDVGRILGAHLDTKAVSTMRKASKATSKLTDVQMEKICASPITAKELLSVINKIPLPFAFGIIEKARGNPDLRLIVVADGEDQYNPDTISWRSYNKTRGDNRR